MQRLGGIPRHPRGLIISNLALQFSRQLSPQLSRHVQKRQRHKNAYRVWPRLKQVPKGIRSPMRNSFPTFEASSLLLDLDAEGNKNVRPFNQRDDGKVKHRRRVVMRRFSMRPLLARIAKFERIYKKQQDTFTTTKNQPFSPWRLNSLDLLSVALHGLPPNSDVDSLNDPLVSADSLALDYLPWILNRNGIPSSVRDSVPKTLSYMRRRQDVLENPKTQSPPDGKDFFASIRRCRNLYELERVVAPHLLSAPGVKLVAENSIRIAIKCRRLHRAGAVRPDAALNFLNDLSINFSSHGLAPLTVFEMVALNFALECGNLALVQRYINACHVKYTRFPVLRAARKSLDHLQQGPADRLDPTRQLLDIYSLLTGWNFGNETAQPSMHLYYREYRLTLLLYFQCLARLGAFRTMWYEWHDCLDNAEGLAAMVHNHRVGAKDEDVDMKAGAKQRPQSDGPHGDTLKTQVLGMMASVYAEAILGSPHVIRAASEFLQCLDFTKAAQNRREECQLEMESIIRLGKTHSWQSISIGGASTVGLYEEGKDEGVIATIFGNRDILASLAGLQALLVGAMMGQDVRTKHTPFNNSQLPLVHRSRSVG